jgi:AcrR family transcriptional regulator
VPRQPDPELEHHILDAASRLWARGGEKSLTMRAVAHAAGTTTPTVYERYHDRDDLLRALRLKTRSELFAALTRTRTLREAVQRQLEFSLEHSYAYEMLFDGVAQPPSLYEAWPSFNLMRDRIARRLGGTPRQHNRLLLALWSLMHGAAMLIIRGRFEGMLRIQTIHACLDAFDAIVDCAVRSQGFPQSGPKWPANLIIGEGKRSRVSKSKKGRRKSRAAKAGA